MNVRNRLSLLGLSLLLGACATGAPQATIPASPLPNLAEVDPVADAAELRESLQAAMSQIELRTSGTVKPAIIDAEAMSSIEIPEHESIRGAVKYFSTTLQPKIQRSLHRSAGYKAMVDKVLDEYRLPRALAYLPVIESAYVPTLTSSAGAYGLWQFMPPTAREYGLNIDWWVDERADPEKATRAAAHYLRDLHRMFGDWSLALAAYNAGPGRVRRALKSSGSTTFWELSEKQAIPKETRGYVPTFYATVLIASDPEAYGFELLEPSSPDVRKVPVVGPVSLSWMAEVAGLETEVLAELNPELRRGVVPPGVTPVRIPAKSADIVRSRAATLRDEDPTVAVASFVMRPGDSISKLARTLGIGEDEILKMNSLQTASVRPGDAIYLPVRQTELSMMLQRRSAPASTIHEVQKGDTLYSIARRNNLTVDELLGLNGLDSSHVLQPGERLRVTLGTALTSGGM